MQRVHIITRSLKLAAIRRYVDHLIEDWKQTQGKLSLCWQGQKTYESSSIIEWDRRLL